MNAKKAKQLRKRAAELTQHAPECSYLEGKTVRLGESTRGAYKVLKSGKYSHVLAV